MSAQLLSVVPSASRPNVSYELRQAQDGHVYCTCPAWKFQRKPAKSRTCKHLKAFLYGRAVATCPTHLL